MMKLDQIDALPGKRTDMQPKDGTGPRSRSEAVREAGLSERQQKTAMRVANIEKVR